MSEEITEIRWHGRGGHGAVTSAELVAKAAIAEGKEARAFPSFGPERRGAPVQAFVRVSNGPPIRVRTEITSPDIVVVLDPRLISVVDVTAGLRPGGLLVINTKKALNSFPQFVQWRLATIDATNIAREVLGITIVNTTMVGALIKATGIVKIESFIQPLEDIFGRRAGDNFRAMQRAYQETKTREVE